MWVGEYTRFFVPRVRCTQNDQTWTRFFLTVVSFLPLRPADEIAGAAVDFDHFTLFEILGNRRAICARVSSPDDGELEMVMVNYSREIEKI